MPDPNDIAANIVAEPLQEALVAASDPQTPQSMAHLLLRAVEIGADVDVLEKLVVLHERVADRQAAQEFADAMAKFQAECPSVAKKSKGDIVTKSGARFSYMYAELDEIARTVNPLLNKRGLSYSWDSEDDGKFMSVTCTVRHANGHSIASRFRVPIDTSAGMSEQQKPSAAWTTCRRQSLISVLGLTTCDPDLDGAGTETISSKQSGDLEALVSEVGADRAAFLKYMGVEAMDDILIANYRTALVALEKKRKAGKP